MKTTGEMIDVNRRQAEFYDSIHAAEADKGHGGYAENQEANLFTRAWAALRYRQQAAVKEAGIEARVNKIHEEWARRKAGGKFLEVGCFSGSRMTFTLAGIAGSYLGVELSPKAVAALNEKFNAAGLSGKAEAQAVDFLTMEASNQFDFLYAHGVLHHFENPQPLFSKLAALAKPDAILVFAEPAAIHPLYRLLRALYRPFQSDAAWEWPFTRRTVEALETHFEPVEGYGWGAWSLPLSVLTGLPLIGGVFRRLYLGQVRKEVEAQWGPGVWNNSYITAVYRPRRKNP